MKISVRSLSLLCKLTNQCSCPDSVHVSYTSMEFLAANCKCELKDNWLVVLGSRISSSFAESKGHEHVANAVTVGINTCFCICFSRLWRSIMTRRI